MIRVATILSAAAVAGALAMLSDAVAAAAPAVDVGGSGTSGSSEDALSLVPGLPGLLGALEGVAPGAGPTGPGPVGSMPSEEFVRGGWFGRWDADGADTAVLNVSSTRLVSANIDIPDHLCNATWTEIGRLGASVLVDVEVTSGDCSANQWVLTMTGDQIIGVDPLHPGTRVTFTRR